ncbi:hypothetical protein Q1695_016296 [Nippostrongylus brasiliensis]|nr:hypothetical protein Q1695_016296 [Nippostrongylus brasiliensis]
MRNRRAAWFLIALVSCTLLPPVETKRGGILGGSRSRGSSASRSGGGGLFGGGGHSGVHQQRPHQSGHGQNTGGSWSGGGWGSGGRQQHGSGGAWSGRSHSSHPKSSGLGKIFGGITGRNRGHHYGGHRFTSHGIGSRSRSNTFKNMIVGAAAGYLTYQAGKAIIRSMAGPMMWNNRPYYWGSNYYRPQRGQENMCRMPVDPSDPQFGNIYQPDGVTRPHEIVWGCGYYEHCCGYECCRGGGAPAVGGYGASVGYAFALIYIARAYLV